MTLFTRSRIATGATAVAVAVVLTAGTAAALFGSSTTAAISVGADSIPTAAAPAASVAGTTATVSFDPISLAGGRPVQSYELLRNDVTVLPCASSPCQDTGLAPGTYTYRVRGVYQQWRGVWSPASDGATVAAPTNSLSVSDITGSVQQQSTHNWSPSVTVTVRDSGGNLASGVVVSGVWSGGWSPSGCTTAAGGTCTITLNPNRVDKGTAATWSVTGLAKATYVYDSAGNSVSSVTIESP